VRRKATLRADGQTTIRSHITDEVQNQRRSTTMATSTSSPHNNASPAFFILSSYIVLGALVSFTAGRTPGTLPANILTEVAPAFLVVCAFLVSYSVLDVLAVGLAKQTTKYGEQRYQDLPRQVPEAVYLAQRVLTNQVEQMPVFLVGSLSCALLVNGRVAGVLSLLWMVLRRRYATVYRGAVGVPAISLSTYTLPAYVVSHTMLLAAVVQAVRGLLVVE
jgi:hypothetical protein